MVTEAYVSVLPVCDFHKEAGAAVPATFDGKTSAGPWANMCAQHYAIHGMGLGTGKGQVLIVGEPPVVNRAEAVAKALAANDYEAFEDAVGDGDPADYLT